MTTNNKRKFTVETNGVAVELAVLRPNPRQQQEGTLVYNRAYREAIEAKNGKPGSLLRQEVDRYMRERNLWDDEKQAEFERLNASLLEGEKKLAKKRIKLSEAKSVAIQMRIDRAVLRDLLAVRNSIDETTAEAYATNARFNYFVSVCTVYSNTNDPYFQDLDDYLDKSGEPEGVRAANNLAMLIYGVDEQFERSLPENKFLLRFKFVDEKLRLVNKDGELVDVTGRRIDEMGRYLNEKGEFVDSRGERVDADGDYVGDEDACFLDDDGNPVREAEEESAASVAEAK